jgi:hypothetical protein
MTRDERRFGDGQTGGIHLNINRPMAALRLVPEVTPIDFDAARIDGEIVLDARGGVGAAGRSHLQDRNKHHMTPNGFDKQDDCSTRARDRENTLWTPDTTKM